jgi:hypothetical protein
VVVAVVSVVVVVVVVVAVVGAACVSVSCADEWPQPASARHAAAIAA